MHGTVEFKPLNIAVLTLSDTRTLATDTSGDSLVELLTQAGHHGLLIREFTW
jgi:molybdenum cofactor biosynthesis protein B